MANHSRLEVWHLANALSLAVHLAANQFPARGAPGLRAQLLRSVASIPANIAEGAGQSTPGQFVQFLGIAIGSANEVETHLTLAIGLGLIAPATGAQLIADTQRVRRMLWGLRKRLDDRISGRND
jgi:four helix bundle protein